MVEHDRIAAEEGRLFFGHVDDLRDPITDGALPVFVKRSGEPETAAIRQRAIRDRIPDIIDVPEEEATYFCCNAVVLARDIVLPQGPDRLMSQLRERGYTCHPLPMTEFLKAGGACKCLTMFMPQRESCVG